MRKRNPHEKSPAITIHYWVLWNSKEPGLLIPGLGFYLPLYWHMFIKVNKIIWVPRILFIVAFLPQQTLVQQAIWDNFLRSAVPLFLHLKTTENVFPHKKTKWIHNEIHKLPHVYIWFKKYSEKSLGIMDNKNMDSNSINWILPSALVFGNSETQDKFLVCFFVCLQCLVTSEWSINICFRLMRSNCF